MLTLRLLTALAALGAAERRDESPVTSLSLWARNPPMTSVRAIFSFWYFSYPKPLAAGGVRFI